MTATSVHPLEALAQDFDLLRDGALKAYELASLETVRIASQFECLADRETATKRVARYEGTWQGWTRRESWCGRTGTGNAVPDDAGPPLDGEWISEEGTSVRLFYDGFAWRFVTIEERADGEFFALKERVKLLARMSPDNLAARPSALDYAVYWGVPDGCPGGIRRLACRFLGFIDDQGKS